MRRRHKGRAIRRVIMSHRISGRARVSRTFFFFRIFFLIFNFFFFFGIFFFFHFRTDFFKKNSPAAVFYCSGRRSARPTFFRAAALFLGAAAGVFERPPDRRPTFYCSGGLVDVSGRRSVQRTFLL